MCFMLFRKIKTMLRLFPGKKVIKLKVGNVNIAKAYLGTHLVFPEPDPIAPAVFPVTLFNTIIPTSGSRAQGLLYDPTDTRTLFQDSAGLIPAYSPGAGQPDPTIGRMLDLSGNDHHAIQPNLTNRPILSARYNRLYSTGSLVTQTVRLINFTYVFSFSGTGSVTFSGAITGTFNAGTHTLSSSGGNVTVTVTGSVNNADLRQYQDGGMSLLPPYQEVLDDSNYTTAGFPQYLYFDGQTKYMYTIDTVDLTLINKLSLGVVLRKYTNALGSFFSSSNDSMVNPGTFTFHTGMEPALGALGFISTAHGNAPYSYTQAATYTATLAKSSVIVGTHDIPGSRSAITVNQTYTGISGTGSKGTGNFGNYTVFIGSEGGTTSFFEGRLYGMLLVESNIDESTVSALSVYLNSKAKVY